MTTRRTTTVVEEEVPFMFPALDPAEVGPPGPRPARTAADPPVTPSDAPAEPPADSSSTLSLEELSLIAADHEQRLAAVEQWWSEMVQGMEAQVASEAQGIAASLETLPEPFPAV